MVNRLETLGPIDRIKRSADILRSVAFVTYKEWAAFRSHMAVSIFVGPVFFLVQYFIWHAVFSTRGSINGLSLEQVLTYYGVAAVINYLTFDFADWNLQMLIRSGKFMTFMLRPVSHLFFALSQKVGHRILSLCFEFLPIYLIFLIGFKVRLIPAEPVWALLSILLSFMMAFLTNYCIGISAFWLTKTNGIRMAFHALRDISAGVLIPLSFFPEGVQKVLLLLPFQFISYVPTRVFIGSYELAGVHLSIPEIVGVQALVTAAMFLLTQILWKAGIKRFTGVGA